jgi:hypothetical protein
MTGKRKAFHQATGLFAAALIVLSVSGCDSLFGNDGGKKSKSLAVSVSANAGGISGSSLLQSSSMGSQSFTGQVFDVEPLNDRTFYREPLDTAAEGDRIGTATPARFVLQLDYLKLYSRPTSASLGRDFSTDSLWDWVKDEIGGIIPQRVDITYSSGFIRDASTSSATHDGITMMFLDGIGESNGMPTTSFVVVDLSHIAELDGKELENEWTDPVEGIDTATIGGRIFQFRDIQPIAVGGFLSYITIGADITESGVQNPQGDTGDWQLPGGSTSGNATALFFSTPERISLSGYADPEIIFNWEMEDLVEVYEIDDKYYATLRLDDPFPISLAVRERVAGGSGGTVGTPGEILAPYIGVAAPSEFGTSEHNTLYWINPSEPTYDRTVVVRKAGSAPTGPSDGEVVHNSHIPAFVDVTGVAGTHYYYGVYTVGHNGSYSAGTVLNRVQGP